MIRYILLFVCSFLPLFLQAQDKTKDKKPADEYNRKQLVRSVKEYHKAQNHAKIEETLNKAFQKYPEARADGQLMNYQLDALYGLMKTENTHIFLNNKADTAKFFSYIYKTYDCALRLDTLDSRPDEKGNVKRRFKENVSSKLSQLRNNLRSGGKYHYKKRNYAEAYNFFDMYLRTVGSPLTRKNIPAARLATFDGDSISIAWLATLSAYAAKQYGKAMTHYTLAARDTTYRLPLLELKADCYRNLSDTPRYLQALQDGVSLYPQNESFYSPLITHYDTLGQFSQSMKIVNRLVALDSANAKYWYLKGKLYQALEQSDSAIWAYKKTIERVDTVAAVYGSLGDMYTLQAHRFYNQADLHLGTPEYWNNRKQLNTIYEKACLAYEKARELAPQNNALWLAGLREAYFRLNRGKELKALEKLNPQKE